MTFSNGFFFLSFVVVLISFASLSSRAQTTSVSVPSGIYIFGDSLVDVGNNNHLPLSILKANYPFNGIDYTGHKATGRFSNGKNAADFLAEKLGLPTAPPFLANRKAVYVGGVSFASGGAGIFNDTDGNPITKTLSMSQQVGFFSNVRQGLVNQMGADAADNHLSKSIFPIVIGSNDLIGHFSSNKNTAHQQYVALMVSTFKNQLQGLYRLGARKFIIVGVAAIGCAPKERFRNMTNECNNELNYWSKRYNAGVVQMLQELKSELNEFNYTFFDIYNIFVDFIQNPATYGFDETKGACCGLGRLRAQFPCTPVSQYCSNRSSHLFWDIYHPTEAATRIFINKLFDGARDNVFPVTIQQLIAA